MTRLDDLVTETRRRALLDILAEAQDYEEGESMLGMVLASMRLPGGYVAEDLAWLAHADLVTLSGVVGRRRAKLTALGLDVSHGAVRAEGVGRKL
jgi:hypothetical protein